MCHPSTDEHTRICPGSNQALLFPCEHDQFNIAPEGNPGLLTRRAMLRIEIVPEPSSFPPGACIYAFNVSAKSICSCLDLPALIQMSHVSHSAPK